MAVEQLNIQTLSAEIQQLAIRRHVFVFTSGARGKTTNARDLIRELQAVGQSAEYHNIEEMIRNGINEELDLSERVTVFDDVPLDDSDRSEYRESLMRYARDHFVLCYEIHCDWPRPARIEVVQ